MNPALFDLGAASTPILLVPAQDILNLLRTRPWSYRKLEEDEKGLLKEAAQFLESVKTGQSIIRQSCENDTFIPDVVSLDAYEYTRRAMESSLVPRYRSFEDTEEFINRVHNAIQTIIQVDNPDEGKNLHNLEEEPRSFFEIFIEYLYGRSLGIPHI